MRPFVRQRCGSARCTFRFHSLCVTLLALPTHYPRSSREATRHCTSSSNSRYSKNTASRSVQRCGENTTIWCTICSTICAETPLLQRSACLTVIGDVYDVAVSTFWPTPHGTRTHFNVLRWYSTFAPGEFDLPRNAQARALLYVRRHWSPRDHLRYFVVEHHAQFVRARAVLQVASAQWWSN